MAALSLKTNPYIWYFQLFICNLNYVEDCFRQYKHVTWITSEDYVMRKFVQLRAPFKISWKFHLFQLNMAGVTLLGKRRHSFLIKVTEYTLNILGLFLHNLNTSWISNTTETQTSALFTSVPHAVYINSPTYRSKAQTDSPHKNWYQFIICLRS
jgi:hypothetical protein